MEFRAYGVLGVLRFGAFRSLGVGIQGLGVVWRFGGFGGLELLGVGFGGLGARSHPSGSGGTKSS